MIIIRKSKSTTPESTAKKNRNPGKIIGFSVFAFFFSKKNMFWRPTFETPQLKPLVFTKATGCRTCFARFEGKKFRWVKFVSWPRQRTKILAKNSQTSGKQTQTPNDGEQKFSDSQGLRAARLGSVALWNDMKHLKLLKSLELLEGGNAWNFPRDWTSRLLDITWTPGTQFFSCFLHVHVIMCLFWLWCFNVAFERAAWRLFGWKMQRPTVNVLCENCAIAETCLGWGILGYEK